MENQGSPNMETKHPASRKRAVGCRVANPLTFRTVLSVLHAEPLFAINYQDGG